MKDWSHYAIEFGVLLYLLLIPFSDIFSAEAQALPLATILVGIVTLRIAVYSSSEFVPGTNLIGLGLLFFLSFAVSIWMSDLWELSLERAYFLPIGLLLLIAFQDAFQSQASLLRLSFVFLAILAALGVNGTYQAYTGHTLFLGEPLYGTRVAAGLPHPNDLVLVPLCLPLALAAVAQQRRIWLFLGTAVIAILSLFTLAVSQSRNALLGLVVVLGVTLVLSNRRRWVLVFLLVGIAAIGLAAFFGLDSVTDRLSKISVTRLQAEGRVGIWIAAWEMFLESPWVGKGPFVYGDLYHIFLERAELPDGYQPEDAFIPWAHSLYLEALAERGILGLATFLLLSGTALWLAFRTWLRASSDGQKLYAGALVATWLGFLVMGVSDLTFLKDWVLIFFLLLVSLSARMGMGLVTFPPSDKELCED
ncbi:MAG: hypothetical protein CL917_14880 [Deltaproteobacteria bacterium]|nr:hypothetical protein [Deltaproteobacteria bacterium]